MVGRLRLFAVVVIVIAAVGLGSTYVDAGSSELIVNGGFETGDLTGWTFVDHPEPFDAGAVVGAGVASPQGLFTSEPSGSHAFLHSRSNFPTLPDRLHQGILNTLFLGQLLIHPDGFASDPAFQHEGERRIDHRRLFYGGNSQGGIVGGAATAVAQDWRDAVLGVPGMNFSVLIPCSSAFRQFLPVVYANYPDELDQTLLLAMAQMLWDRGEANGYAHHMTDDPLPNTPAPDRRAPPRRPGARHVGQRCFPAATHQHAADGRR